MANQFHAAATPCSRSLAVIWIALANEVSAGSIAMGLVLESSCRSSPPRSGPTAPRIRRPLKVVEYVMIVLYDIVVANLQVARLILSVPNEGCARAT